MNEPNEIEPRVSQGAWIIGLPVVLVFLLIVFASRIAEPWVEEDTWYGAVYSQAAHNNLRAGLTTTAGVPATLYFGPLPIPAIAYYVHHPTLLPLMVTAAFAIFGEHEWAARLVPVACSLLSVAILWLLVRSVADARAATLSAAFFAAVPMELHYGDMVDFEPCLMMWMLAAILFLRFWEKSRETKWLVLSGACCQLALWTEWPSYFFVLTLAASLWLARRREAGAFALILFAMVAWSAVLFLLQIHFVNPGAWSEFASAIQSRLGKGVAAGSGSGAVVTKQFTFLQWLCSVARDVCGNFSVPMLVAALVGVGWLRVRRANHEGLRWLCFAAVPLTIPGLLYVVGLRNFSYIHDFASFYLLGILAILAGIAVGETLRWIENTNRPWSLTATALAVVAICSLAASGWRRSEEMRSQFLLLDGETSEPRDLAPVLGSVLASAFAPDTTILANFDVYGSALTYYTQRTILNNLMLPKDWRTVIAREKPRVGGVIWLGDPGAADILAALPRDQLSESEVEGIHFTIWQPR